MVGHTHNHLDATYGKASVETYGTHSRGDSRKDILSFKDLHTFFKKCFGDRLKSFDHLKGSYNFDTFVENNIRNAFKGIQKHFKMQLSIRNGVVSYRHKDRVASTSPWSRWMQIYPSRVQPAPTPSTCPATAPLKEWSKFETIHKDLTMFYQGRLRSTVTQVPVHVRDEMVAFLDHQKVGDVEPVPPQWVRWGDNEHRVLAPATPEHGDTTSDSDMEDLPELIPDTSDSDEDASDEDASDEDASDEGASDEGASDEGNSNSGDSPTPAAAAASVEERNPDGRMCRCGSLQHLTVSHKSCPLNRTDDVLELFDGDEHVRLQRYVPRTWVYRYPNPNPNPNPNPHPNPKP